MADDLTALADRIYEQALERTGARDPREFYRERLRTLKDTNPVGYDEAVAYYRETLIPAVASEDGDPVAAWTEYGRRLAHSVSAGRTVSIDASGRSHPYEKSDPGRLILHLPDDSGSRALLVALPTELTSAQRATYDVLVAGKQRTRG
ncbi:MAG: hypothetical protein OEN56_06435 [Gemmatimonadota bacterium]|nr:hypothetical protein [Gemmatimonadota bacterium]